MMNKEGGNNHKHPAAIPNIIFIQQRRNFVGGGGGGIGPTTTNCGAAAAKMMMHSTMDLPHIHMEEQKRSFGFPSSPMLANHQNGHTNSHNPNGNGSQNNSPPADSNGGQNQFLAPRPLRRCRSASPVPQRQQPQLPQGQQANGGAGAIYHSQLLSAEQQALIRKSWLKISKATFGATIFEKMLERSPGIERLFNPADPCAIGRHERYFAELAQWAVDGMADPEKMLGNWLEMVGRGHGQFRVKRVHWDYMGEALTETICQSATITGRQRRETVHAWRILLSFIADRLGTPAPAVTQPDPFNRIHLLQLVSDGPRPYQQSGAAVVEEKEQKTP